MRFSVSPGVRSLSLLPTVSDTELVQKYNLQRLIKMASNENCYGPSPLVIAAIEEALSKIHRYPDVYGAELKEKLAIRQKVNAAQIVLANGSTELVEMIAKTFLQPGEKCLTAEETFPVYGMAANFVNAVCETVPLTKDTYDLQGILKAIDSNTRLIFIANPNNPTGTALSAGDLQQFLARVPPNVLVVLDQAYREYAKEPVEFPSLPENLILLRTFSKVYGLAGLRIGYAICAQEVASHLNKVSLPYAVNVIGQIGASSALEDQQHVANCVEKNRQQRDVLQNEFRLRGYPFVYSQTNFILLKVTEPSLLRERLLQKGILVAVAASGIRITLGSPEENQVLLEALAEISRG